MKRIYRLLSILFIATSFCMTHPKTGFNIEGDVKGLKNGERLFLLIKRGGKIDTVGTAIAKNGVFEIKNVRLPVYPDFYLLAVQTEFVENLKLFLDQAGDIKIKGDLKNWQNVHVIGSATHNDYLACRKLRNELQAKDFLLKYPDRIADADTVTMYTLKEFYEMIKLMPNSDYLAYWLVTMKHPAASYGYHYSFEQKKPLYDALSPKVKESKYGQILREQIDDYFSMRKRAGEIRKILQTLKSVSPPDALKELNSNVKTKIAVKILPKGTSKITHAQIRDRLEQATVIMNMAFKLPGRDSVEFNPTTAYIIDESGICVTNYHVGKEYVSKPYLSLSVMTKNGKNYPVNKILSYSESDDLMLFQVDTKGDKLVALPLGNTAPKGSFIHVMGHPNGNFYRHTSGLVSGYSPSILAGQSCNVMSITADFAIGSSGGPIVDEFGNVVGTVSRVEGGMKVGIPIEELKKLLILK